MENISAGPDGLWPSMGRQGQRRLDHAEPLRVRGRPDRGGRLGRQVLHLGGRQDVAGGDRQPRQVLLRCRAGPLRVPAQVPARRMPPGFSVWQSCNDVQMAPFPCRRWSWAITLFTYTDESPGDRRVRITHHWIERSATRPPPPPAGPDLLRPMAGKHEGTDVVFQWTPADDPDGDPIADYHFELSSRADMRYPLSMCFYKLISRTADITTEKAPKARYTLLQPGLLTPDRQYYWHVRAMDSQGVWGPWSKTWRFTPRGPAYPFDLTVELDRAAGFGNPAPGRPTRWAGRRSSTASTAAMKKASRLPISRSRASVGVTKAEMASWKHLIPREFHRRDGSHRTEGDRLRRRLARSQQDLLPRRGRGRARQAQRTLRLCSQSPACDPQPARG